MKNGKKIRKILLLVFLSGLLLNGCAAKEGSGEDADRPTATVSIRCDTAVANGMAEEDKWKGIIPEDGCILPETEVEYSEGDTVFDLLCQVTDQYGIQMEYNGTAGKEYIEGIQNLYEYDGGRWSGWMYSVNGEYPGTGCGDCQVSDGDRIEWNYTCDLGMDLEGADMEDAAEWKETRE